MLMKNIFLIIWFKFARRFDRKNFEILDKLFNDLKGESYSINRVEKILEEIDKITLEEQYGYLC